MDGNRLTVVSGKGGVGKSMLVVTLGALWAARGRRVALVDINTGMRGLDMLLGLENRIVFDLGDVLEGLCAPRQALVEDKRTGMRVIAARQISDTETLDLDALDRLTRVLSRDFDIVILDAASGIGRGFTAAVQAADRALLVTTPDDMALRDADRVSGLLQRLDMPPPLVVLNRIRPDLVEEGLQYEPRVCAQVLDMPIFAVIPDDDEILRCTLRKEPATGGFPAAEAMANLLDRLENASLPVRPWREGAGKSAKAPPEEAARGLFGRRRRAPADSPERKFFDG